MNYGFRNRRERQFPLMLCLEITNVCNYRCIHCPYPVISKKKNYRPKFLAWNVFKKIADETANFKDTIFRFVCDGEPMMHPDFLRMVEYAKGRGISPVCVTTNGYFLTEKSAQRLLKCGCDLVEISLDALSEESYKKIRIDGNFDRVIKNTFRLIKLRKTAEKNTKLMVSIIDQPLARQELSAFTEYWGNKVDRVIVRKLTSIGGFIATQKPLLPGVQESKRWPCPLLWRRLFINVEGFAEFCVDDWLDESIIADAGREKISQIWKKRQYRQLRQWHAKKRFDKIKKCAGCADWPARTWQYDYCYALGKVMGQAGWE